MAEGAAGMGHVTLGAQVRVQMEPAAQEAVPGRARIRHGLLVPPRPDPGV